MCFKIAQAFLFSFFENSNASIVNISPSISIVFKDDPSAFVRS